LMGLLAAMCAIDASRSGTLVLLNCWFLCGARIYYAAKGPGAARTPYWVS
jgi:hypothetical protein